MTQLTVATERKLGSLANEVYADAVRSTFTDVTVDDNQVSDTIPGFTAAAGWDACTGLGTPNGTALLEALRSC